MYTPPSAVRTAVETTLQHNPDAPEAIQDVDASVENDVLYVELQLRSQFTPEDTTKAVQAGVLAYCGAVVPLIQQQIPLPVGRAAIDLVECSESHAPFRCELPNEWIRDHLAGELSYEELLHKPLSSSYLVGEDGTPRSLEEAFKETLREETDLDPEGADLQALADEYSY